MSDLHEIGLIDKTTMREFDASCLTPVEPLLPKDVLALLTREGVNQAVMARHLYVAEDPVANGIWTGELVSNEVVITAK